MNINRTCIIITTVSSLFLVWPVSWCCCSFLVVLPLINSSHKTVVVNDCYYCRVLYGTNTRMSINSMLLVGGTAVVVWSLCLSVIRVLSHFGYETLLLCFHYLSSEFSRGVTQHTNGPCAASPLLSPLPPPRVWLLLLLCKKSMQ